MRHIGRTHGVSVAWMFERFQQDDYSLGYCDTADQAADIYTKAFSDPLKWKHACELAGVVDPKTLPRVIKEHEDRWQRQASAAESGASKAKPVPDDWTVEAAPAMTRGVRDLHYSDVMPAAAAAAPRYEKFSRVVQTPESLTDRGVTPRRTPRHTGHKATLGTQSQGE